MPRFEDLAPRLKRAVKQSTKKETELPTAHQTSLFDQLAVTNELSSPPRIHEGLTLPGEDDDDEGLHDGEASSAIRYHESIVNPPEYEIAARADVLLPVFQYLTPGREDEQTRELYRLRLAAILSVLQGATLELTYRDIRARLAWIRPGEEASRTMKRMLKYRILEDTGYGYDVNPWAKVAVSWILQVSGEEDPERLLGLQVSALSAGAEADNEEDVVAASLKILLQELGQAILFCDYAIKSRAPNLLRRALRRARSYRDKLDRLTVEIEELAKAGYPRLQIQACLEIKERLIGQLTRIYTILTDLQVRGLDSFSNYLTSEELIEFLLQQPSLDGIGRLGLQDFYTPKPTVVVDPVEVWHKAQQAFGEEFEAPPVAYQDLTETPVDEGVALPQSDLDQIRAEVASILMETHEFAQIWFETRPVGGQAPSFMQAVLRAGLLSSIFADGHEHAHRLGALVIEMMVDDVIQPCAEGSPYAAANDGTVCLANRPREVKSDEPDEHDAGGSNGPPVVGNGT